MDSLPYNAVPKPTAYNVAVFFLNFENRSDYTLLGKAFCQDFDILDTKLSDCFGKVEAIKMILEYID